MKIKLIRSTIGASPKQKRNLQALGLKRMNQVKEVPDNPCVRGQVRRVNHMLEVIES
ncbi:MAG: 50S ribosomal protein L30 [Desulfohalobiaceae bacterium]